MQKILGNLVLHIGGYMHKIEPVTLIHPYDFYDILTNLDEKSYIRTREDGFVEVVIVYNQTSAADVSPSCSLRADPNWKSVLSKSVGPVTK